MNTMTLREEADYIIQESIRQVLPDEAVRKALKYKQENGGFSSGRLILVAAGKAAWQMAKTASDYLGDKIDSGICITKYDHVKGS
ncbi:MAG: DUF4147 domain-containing protein, partial [Lachnospiraceae bacterium]|nr:DUF4147 domain-containing protein [Lachnospiraceae bacterium]